MNRKFILAVVMVVIAVTILALAGVAGAASPKAALAGSAPTWAKVANFKSAPASDRPWVSASISAGVTWPASKALAQAVSDPRAQATVTI